MRIVVCSCVDSDLVRSVAARIGTEASTYTTVAETRYRALSGGGRPARFWLRWLMTGGYSIRLGWRVLRSESDTLWVVTTNPFFAPGLAAVVSKLRGQKVVHHVFDLYPDALVAAGVAKEGSIVANLIAVWTRFSQRTCAGAVYLGEELRRHTEACHGATPCSAVIAVSADEREFLPAQRDTLSEGPLRLHYGGHLGAMHDADGLVEGCGVLAAERAVGRVEFHFMVGGEGARRLSGVSAEVGVAMHGTIASAAWREEAARHHIGLVALTPAGMHVCLPSKVYAMMAAGLAIVAICPERSDLATLVRETGAGWVIDNTDGNAKETGRRFADLVRELIAKPEMVHEARRCARRAAETTYGHVETSRRWREFVAELKGGGG